MVGDSRISAVLVSTDLEKCRAFYETKVGLKVSPETIKNHLIFECGGGTTLLVYGRPRGNAADHTQVRFWSKDVAADVAELSARGVAFEDVRFPRLQDDRPHRDHGGRRPFGVVQGSGRQHDCAVSTGMIAACGARPKISRRALPGSPTLA